MSFGVVIPSMSGCWLFQAHPDSSMCHFHVQIQFLGFLVFCSCSLLKWSGCPKHLGGWKNGWKRHRGTGVGYRIGLIGCCYMAANKKGASSLLVKHEGLLQQWWIKQQFGWKKKKKILGCLRNILLTQQVIYSGHYWTLFLAWREQCNQK